MDSIEKLRTILSQSRRAAFFGGRCHLGKSFSWSVVKHGFYF